MAPHKRPLSFNAAAGKLLGPLASPQSTEHPIGLAPKTVQWHHSPCQLQGLKSSTFPALPHARSSIKWDYLHENIKQVQDLSGLWPVDQYLGVAQKAQVQYSVFLLIDLFFVLFFPWIYGALWTMHTELCINNVHEVYASPKCIHRYTYRWVGKTLTETV